MKLWPTSVFAHWEEEGPWTPRPSEEESSLWLCSHPNTDPPLPPQLENCRLGSSAMPQWDARGDKGMYFSGEHWGMEWEEDAEAGGDEEVRSKAQPRLEPTNVMINKEWRT